MPAIIVVSLANAQIKKGAHFIGGSFGVSTENTEINNTDFKSHSFNVSPAYGRAIRNNLIIGVDLQFSNSDNETTSFDMKQTGIGAGFFARKYQPLGKNFYLFGQGRIGGGYSKVLYEYPLNADDRETKITSVQASIYPGISYAINNKLHIETGFNDLLYIQYAHEETDHDANFLDSKTNRFSLGSSLSSFNWFTVGLRFIFN